MEAFAVDSLPPDVGAYRDEWAIAPLVRQLEHRPMKRIAAVPLWFLVGWYVGSATGWMLGIGPVFAPIMATAVTALVVVDPRRYIWDRN